MKPILPIFGLVAAFVCASCTFQPIGAAPKAIKAEGADLTLGGKGEGKGKFLDIADLAFNSAGELHVLDGLIYDNGTKTWSGNALVQKFDVKGKFQSQFSIRNAELGGNDAPKRIAVDGAGRVYVSKPAASRLEQYAADGKLLQSLEIPGVVGVAKWKRGGGERIVALGGTLARVNRKSVTLGGDEILVLNAEGSAIENRVKLERALENVEALATDKAGNFYVLAGQKQLFQFDSSGKLRESIGVGIKTRDRFYDGSQLAEGLAVDSKGNVVAGAWGSPAMFDAKFETITKRPGLFNAYEGWGGRSRFAFDPNDRLWVASARNEPKANPQGRYFVDKPVVMRLATNYFDSKQRGYSQISTANLGFFPQISTNILYHVAHQIGPFPLSLGVALANRRIQNVEARWRLLDSFGSEVDKGKFDLDLKNGEAAQKEFTVSPPRNGWYSVVMQYAHNNQILQTDAKFIGVSPRYAGMDAPTGNDPKQIGPKGSWEDPVRQVYSGLQLMRLHPAKGLDKLNNDINAANAAGATFFVQLTDDHEVAPEKVRALVTRFKGRVPVYEIINEPNISLKGGLTRYIEIWKTVAPIIKEIDPNAKLMGPATVNMDLGFVDKFLAACAPLVDIVSIHDYEGHGTIDATHWKYKIGEMRKMMTKYGLADKQLWQTERANGAVFRSNFQGLAQAVGLTYHRDLLQSLGIAPEHNQHYYLNEGGYGSVATYVWSPSGPHPAALALRTRHALTRNRAYLGTVDFGPTGNKFFFGLRFGPLDGDGGLIVVRNMGAQNAVLSLQTTGTPEVRDAFDNLSSTKANGNKMQLIPTQLPTYIRLPAGSSVQFPKWNWGQNFAREAKFIYSAPSTNPAAPVVDATNKPAGAPVGLEAAPEDALVNPHNLLPILLESDPTKLLVNGVSETHHHGGIYGGARATPMFRGELPTFPQNLDITFPTARPISKIAIFSEYGDNAFCALLDYDVQAKQNGSWKTLAEVRTPIPESTPAASKDATSLTWMPAPNRSFVEFPAPVTTSELRLVIRRTTFGFAPDEGVRGWSSILKPALMLREIEIY